jgi:hypothetical protein
MRRRGSGWMGQQMINVEKINKERESKTDREKSRQTERACMRRRGSGGI